MDFHTLFPGATTWVEGLPKVWPFVYLQDIYAPFGALHLVGLALLGGCVILLNLRLIGTGLTQEPPSVVERGLNPWLITGTAIVLITGIIIGCLNSAKLYYSPAFFIKMVAMVAALVFSFGVTNAIAKTEGTVGSGARIAAGVAFALWLFSLGVFSTTTGANPGVFHIILAGYAILMIFGSRTRLISALAIAICFGGMIVTYFVVGMDNPDPIYLDLSRYSLIAASVILVGLLGFEIFTGKAEAASPLARLIALFSILTWVTVAAGGRWIGFS